MTRTGSIHIKRSKVESIIESIINDSSTANDIQVLFIELNPIFRKRGLNSLIELRNMFAHPEGINHGSSYNYIEKFVNNLIKVSIEGGRILHNGVFSKKEIIKQLSSTCSEVIPGTSFKDTEIEARIISYIQENISEREIKLKIAEVTACHIEKTSGDIFLSLRVNIAGKYLRITDAMKYRIPMFRD